MKNTAFTAYILILATAASAVIAQQAEPVTIAEITEPAKLEAAVPATRAAATELDGIVIRDGGGIALRDAGQPSLRPASNRLQWAHPAYSETTELYYQDNASFNIDLRSAGARALRVTNSSTGVANLIVDEGNVGIGTWAPAVRLHVNGPVRGSDANRGALEIKTLTGSVRVGSWNTSWAHFLTDRPSFYFNKEMRVNSGRIGSYDEDLSLATAGATRVTVKKSSGNVGIGRTSPAAKLDVGGEIAINGQRIVDSTGKWVGTPIPSRITSVVCKTSWSSTNQPCENACNTIQPGNSVLSEQSFQGVGSCTASTGGDSCQAAVTPEDDPNYKGLCCACEAIR